MTARRLALGWVAAVGVAAASVVPSSGVGIAPVDHASRLARMAAGAPTPGSPDSGDSLFPHQGNGGYNVSHYGIALSWSRTNAIHATTHITATAKKSLSSFNLDLWRLSVDSVRVDGETATFTRVGSELTVTPPQSLAQGATFTTVVAYHGVPQTFTDPDGAPDGWIKTPDGATVLSEPVGAMTWFPNNDTPRDKAAYDIRVTAPQNLTVVSNGRLRRTTQGPGTTTWSWRETDLMSSYLASVSIGDYDVVLGRTADGIPIRSYLDPTMGGRGRAEQVAKVVTAWEQLFGPYPFTSTGLIIDNVDSGYALEVQTRPVFDSVPDTATLVHEFAHQWFGDSVTAKDWSDIWLHEGFATYAEWLWAARSQPGAPRAIFDHLYATHNAGDPFWNIPVARPGDGSHLFGDAVYTRGAMALEALRIKIGSAAFFRLLKRWPALHRQSGATTRDLRVLAERVSGRPLAHFFHVWLFTAKKPGGYGALATAGARSEGSRQPHRRK